ncbi:hypothetical protein M2169_003557 [Streptomyces sp. MJP52]|nr:hypothetical protein [Streptomyces sp. MJP52]
MSAMQIALLVISAAACAVGSAVLVALRRLRREFAAVRAELEAAVGPAVASSGSAGQDGGARVPAARPASDTDDIRAAVAEALAEERERELAEARAFWAAQEARDASEARSLLGLPQDGEFFLPHPADFAGLELDAEGEGESAELAAARRRHPSHPDFTPAGAGSPTIADDEQTLARLEELAQAETPLADVRPGPMGTLDVYEFVDGTTLCVTPGHRETAERLASAIRDGEAPALLGGSGISGGYVLTFTCGPTDNICVLADRVIASL